MALFFFHYHTPGGATLDDMGCAFDTLEDAYVDAYRSAVDLGAEMLKAHCNPASHRIDIANGDGLVLMELRFDEIFRGHRAKPPVGRSTRMPVERSATFKALRDDLNEICLAARENVARAHEVLRRARVNAYQPPSSEPWLSPEYQTAEAAAPSPSPCRLVTSRNVTVAPSRRPDSL